jgi:hypothetical protein
MVGEMTARRAAAIGMASAAATATAAVVLLSTGGSGMPRAAGTPVGQGRPPAPGATRIHRGVRVGCARRSEASFPGAFSAPGNLVVGPLALIGGAYTPASVVHEFGGNKFPLLVKAGHTVTVRLAHEARRSAGLAYAGLGRGPLPQGRQLALRDAADSMTFVACRPGKATPDYRPAGPSGSDADGESVTFWSGFVLTRAPACIPLEVYVDGESSPRHVGMALGRRCAARRIVQVSCQAGSTGTTEIAQNRDVTIGRLVLLGARRMASRAPDAFNRHGYKVPVTLPHGATATLSVPRRLTDRVGLVFSHRTQDRVWRRGVGAADTAVEFTACPATGMPRRTGWAGGLVVDRRRCATLTVRVPGAAPVSRRVPLGRPC